MVGVYGTGSTRVHVEHVVGFMTLRIGVCAVFTRTHRFATLGLALAGCLLLVGCNAAQDKTASTPNTSQYALNNGSLAAADTLGSAVLAPNKPAMTRHMVTIDPAVMESAQASGAMQQADASDPSETSSSVATVPVTP